MAIFNFQIRSDNTEQVMAAYRNALARALMIIGGTATDYAKNLAPVDTGRLRSSLRHEEDERSTTIGTDVEYAPYQELGTRNMRAQPFLRPAVEEHMQEYRTILEEELRNA